MATTIYATEYQNDGTAALDPQEGCRFVLIEGGRSQSQQAVSDSQEQAVITFPQVLPLSLLQQCVIVAIALIIAAAAITLSSVLSEANFKAVHGAFDAAPTEQIVVSKGESLWSIAEDHSVEGISTDQLVQFIMESNNLSSATLNVGQTLMVPMSS